MKLLSPPGKYNPEPASTVASNPISLKTKFWFCRQNWETACMFCFQSDIHFVFLFNLSSADRLNPPPLISKDSNINRNDNDVKTKYVQTALCFLLSIYGLKTFFMKKRKFLGKKNFNSKALKLLTR